MPRKHAKTLPAFTPVPRQKVRACGWTPERQLEFIEALADTGSVKSAAHAVGLTPKSAYLLRRAEGASGFRKAWEAALDIGIQRIEDVAMDRALNGVEEPVFAYGKMIGTRRVYNDQLLMFMLRSRSPKRFTGGQPKGLNGADQFMLKRLKKDWRREWEAEQALLAHAQEESVLQSLNAKLDHARVKEEQAQRFMLEDFSAGDEVEAVDEDQQQDPPDWLRQQWAERDQKPEPDQRQEWFNAKGERWRE